MEGQTLGPGAFEVLVIDDGSPDETPAAVEHFARQTALTLRYLRQENRGPAAARNRGIAASSGAMLVLLGDDMIPAPDFLAQHLQRHRRHGCRPQVVVIGYSTWPAEMDVTPFVRYSGQYGPQFLFGRMPHEGPYPYSFFYSSNASLSRQLLDGLEYPFDEDFTAAMQEDTELAYRLARQGMELYFHPQAVAYHEHPTTMRQSCRRMQQAGGVSQLMLRKHPEVQHSPRQAWLRRLPWFRRGLMQLLPAADFIDRRWRLKLPGLVYRAVTAARFAAGLSRPATAATADPELCSVGGTPAADDGSRETPAAGSDRRRRHQARDPPRRRAVDDLARIFSRMRRSTHSLTCSSEAAT